MEWAAGATLHFNASKFLRRFCRIQWKIICSSTAERNVFLARRLHHRESAHWRSSRTNECQSKQIAAFDSGCVLRIKDVASHLRPVKVKMTMKVLSPCWGFELCFTFTATNVAARRHVRADATCAGVNSPSGIFCNKHCHVVENPQMPSAEFPSNLV